LPQKIFDTTILMLVYDTIR